MAATRNQHSKVTGFGHPHTGRSHATSSSQANRTLRVEGRRTWTNNPNPSMPSQKSMASVPVTGAASRARGQLLYTSLPHELDPGLSHHAGHRLSSLPWKPLFCCNPHVPSPWCKEISVSTPGPVPFKTHGPQLPTLCHLSVRDRKRCDGARRQELKCRGYSREGVDRSHCIISNSDSDTLPAGPFSKPQHHKNDFPDQRRAPGCQAYVPWMRNNSVAVF